MDKGIIVHCAIVQGDRLLILKRVADTYLGNRWDIPGGSLEDGEDPAQGAIRETFEETGIRISRPALFFHYFNVDEKKDKQFITLVFLQEMGSDPGKIILNPREHSEFAWMRLEDVGQYDRVDYLPSLVDALKAR
jgi:8-oxo-dGTP diphosphatase